MAGLSPDRARELLEDRTRLRGTMFNLVEMASAVNPPYLASAVAGAHARFQ